MKNFSELLDTDIKISIAVTISPISLNGNPSAQIKINNQELYCNKLSDVVEVRYQVDLLDPIEIEIGLSNKIYDQNKETAIIINSLSIDDFEIVPNFTHLTHYYNERNIDSPTSYLGFNGVWKLSIPEPFYRWHHRVTGQGWLLNPVAGLQQK